MEDQKDSKQKQKDFEQPKQKDLQQVLMETYEIVGKIGAGGGGEVYKAFHKGLRKDVVIKKIHSNIKDIVDPRAEVDILKHLKHPYLPQVLNYWILNGEVYTVMEFIPGKTMRQLLDEKQKFRKSQLIQWAIQLTEVVSYLHSRTPPIIHGDIKPDNIICTPEGNICLIDFNISSSAKEGVISTVGHTDGYSPLEQYKIYQRGQEQHKESFEKERETQILMTDLTETGTLLWNPTQEEKSVKKTDSPSHPYVLIDQHSDIYSIGATLYHLVTGVRPAKAGSPIVPLESYQTAVGDAFLTIIRKAMMEQPRDRYSSAQKMLKALRGISKSDHRYRRLWKFQFVVYVMLLVMFTGCAMLTRQGIQTIGKEKNQEYQDTIAVLANVCQEKEYDKVEELFLQALEKKTADTIEPYYYKCYALYQQEQYTEEISWIERVFETQNFIDSPLMGEVYYVTGNCYFELEYYPEAVSYFKKAISQQPNRQQYYRDYAIALARMGELEQADHILHDALEQGLEEDSVFLVYAELIWEKKEYSKGEFYCRQCIDSTKDSYIKMRAYLLGARFYDECSKEGDTLAAEKKLVWLEEATKVLPNDRQLGILEALVQAYLDKFNDTKDSIWATKAIEIFQKEIQMGWAGFDTYYNLSILYQQLGKIEQAIKILSEMRITFGEDYRILKRLAFAQAEQQSAIENSKRDYTVFDQFYHKAKESYQEQLKNNSDDLEMQLLDDLHTQLEAGGWIHESE